MTPLLLLLLLFLIGLLALGGFVAWCTWMPGANPSRRGSPFDAGLPAGDDGLRDRLEAHVIRLAGDIGERNVWNPEALEAAADYIHTRFASHGYDVARQDFGFEGIGVSNLEVALPGTDPDAPVIVLGAHYDTVPGSPGADDNASGVAAMLEIAGLLAGLETPLRRSVHLVAFTCEEPPFFRTRSMGSHVYARGLREREIEVEAMISLEMLGYFRDEKGSQAYPPGIGWRYPNRADFVAFVGNLGSRGDVVRALRAFRASSPFPAEGIAAPALVAGIDFSDHLSFWKNGYPGIMVTDTAFLRNPHYHGASDRPATLDYERLAEVTVGLAGTAVRLAQPE